MPANATQQTTQHSGGDSQRSDSLRTNDSTQENLQSQSTTQSTKRNGVENRESDSTRTEDSSTRRDASSTSSTERAQTTDGSGTSLQSSRDVTLVEKPQIIRRTRQTGGGQASVMRDDIAMTISFELEVLSPLSGR